MAAVFTLRAMARDGLLRVGALTFLMTLACLSMHERVLAQDISLPSLSVGEIAVFQWHESPNDKKALRGLKRGLRLVGYEKIVVFDAKRNKQHAEKFLAQAEQKGVRCVVALGTKATQLALKYCPNVMVFFTAVTNPVLAGIVPSWQGGRALVCGNSNWLDRRFMLESFRAAVPGLKRLAVLHTANNAVSQAEIAEARRALKAVAGKKPATELLSYEIKGAKDFDRQLKAACANSDAIWVPIDIGLYQQEAFAKIVAQASAAKIPVVSSSERCAGRGALLVLAVDYELLGLRAAALVDRVLRRGQNPAALKVGRLTSSRLYVDLDVASRLGRRLPLPVVLDAWRVFRTGRPR
ncbi:MAG: ABC transporter substrate-binding protein [Planctomycetota bacterium]